VALSSEETKKIHAALNEGLRSEYARCAKLVPALKGVTWEKFCHNMPKAAVACGYGLHIGNIESSEGGVVTRGHEIQLSYLEAPGSNLKDFLFTQSSLSLFEQLGARVERIVFGTVIPAAIAYGHLKLTGKEALAKVSELTV